LYNSKMQLLNGVNAHKRYHHSTAPVNEHNQA
jgi:hypothetical protein